MASGSMVGSETKALFYHLLYVDLLLVAFT